MTSVRKITANRANAQASTGPRTARGKHRVAQNACRHGLSLPIVSIPALSQKAESLAREFAGESADQELLELARRVAEAQIDLLRIRQARHDILVRTDPGVNCDPDATKQLSIIDRYERRAFSRRKFAAREFDARRRQTAA
jgi:hypothetical protein